MKILVIFLPEASPELLFGGDGMETMPYLVSIGSYGFLSGDQSRPPAWLTLASQESDAGQGEILTIWDFLREAGKTCLSVGSPPGFWNLTFENPATEVGEIRDGIDNVKSILENQAWDYCQILDNRFTPKNDNLPDYLKFDIVLKDLLEILDESTLIFIITETQAGADGGSFVFAAPNNPITGELEGGSLVDVAPTILELAGYPLPEKIQGHSWVSGIDLHASLDSGLSAEEEEILRERLSGLGYI
jgi:hypothetical protein